MPPELRAKALDWMYSLFAHNQNETQAILRAATAIGHGLDPSKYVSTFPGSTTNVTIVGTPNAAPDQNVERSTLNSERSTLVSPPVVAVTPGQVPVANAAGGAPAASPMPEAPADNPPPAVSIIPPVPTPAPVPVRPVVVLESAPAPIPAPVPAPRKSGWFITALLSTLMLLAGLGLGWSIVTWLRQPAPAPGTGETGPAGPAGAAGKSAIQPPALEYQLVLPDAPRR